MVTVVFIKANYFLPTKTNFLKTQSIGTLKIKKIVIHFLTV